MSFEKIRAGNRGGIGLFDWKTVKEGEERKHAANYLGSSVKAASGRWTERKDINFMNKLPQKLDSAGLDQEVEELKRAEQAAFAAALGYQPPPINQPPEIKSIKEKKSKKRRHSDETEQERAIRKQAKKDKKAKKDT